MRRTDRDGSAAEVIVMAASLMPWWVCLILAFLSWAILHHIAGIKVVTEPTMNGLFQFAGKQLWITMAWFGQIVLPGLFTIAAIISGSRKISEKK